MPGRIKPVVGLDVDGTLAGYHDHFCTFAAAWLGKEPRLGYDGSVPLAKWLGCSRTRYRQIKLGYRQSGLKRAMPFYPNARDLTVHLRRAGAEVVICTTRPYLHLSNIEPDTVESLKRNGIQYDDMIMGEHKYRQLAREYGKENVVMVLDDLPEQLDVALAIGLPAVMRRNDHNWMEAHKYDAVGTLLAAKILGLQRIRQWKAER